MRCAARKPGISRTGRNWTWEGEAPAEPAPVGAEECGSAGALPSRFIMVLLAGVVVVAIGCQQQNPHAGELADFKEVFPHQSPTPVEHPKSVLVAEGVSPLVFQVREPSVVHVMDLTRGEEIVSASVGRDQMVYVSEDSGVFAGKQKLAAGPFAPGHRYGISLDTDSGQSWQTRTEAPHPAPPPATQVAPGRDSVP
jgi:hypothetical protein